MKALMLTTAIALATATGAVAQTAAPGTAPAETTLAPAAGMANVPGFRASDFTGMNLYTLNPEVVTELRSTRAPAEGWNERAARWTSTDTFIAGRDRWEDVGSINDIILSQDGEVRGVLLDVGGFLGIGARTVMIGIDDLYFVADTQTPENLSDFFVVASLSREQLETLPEWTDDNLSAGYSWDGAAVGTPDSGAVAGAMTGTTAAPGAMTGTAPAATDTTAAPMDSTMAAAPTAEDLTGADVHDMSGTAIGNISDIMLDGDRVTGAVIDVGGFLGIGSHRVVVPVTDLTVVRNAENAVVRVETSLTRAQLEAMPKHEG